jgi:ribonuclease P protein component
VPVERLKRRADFVRIARAGRSFAVPGLVLQMQRRDREIDRICGDGTAVPPIRYGITASRKVGGAVERNRVRRRLRAAALQVLPLYARAGCDYVLIGREATLRRPFQELLKDLTMALKRLGALRRSQEPGPGSQPAGGEGR